MKFLGRLKAKKAVVAALLAVVMVPMTMVVAFADDGGVSSVIDFSSIFNEDLFAPLLEGITSNVGVLLRVGLGLLAIFFGIRFIRNVRFFLDGAIWAAKKDQEIYGYGSFWDWFSFYLKPSSYKSRSRFFLDFFR